MDAADFEFEELGVSESVGLSFHGFDFVVGAFQGGGRDRVVVPGQNALGDQVEQPRPTVEIFQRKDAKPQRREEPFTVASRPCVLASLR